MHNWKKTILNQSATMQEAIQVLDKEAMRIVMVINDNNQLIGTLTDGDIRRGLIRHLPMEIKIAEIMFKEPTVAMQEESRKSILAKMKKRGLFQIPIVDKNRTIVGLETIQHILEKKQYDNPVLLMAGGFGTRLHPLTEHTPKPLLKVGGKPILENILEQFIAAGFHNFYITTHYKAEMVQKYFGGGSDLGVSINYIQEKKPLGTAGALGLLPNEIPDLPIILMNGDILTKVDFQKLLSFHTEHGGDVTMCVREYDFQVPYGVIKAEKHRVTKIVEKPVHKFFINAGIYVLNPEVLNAIDGKSYLDMPLLLNEKINRNRQVNMFPVYEYWLDIGQMEEFERAQKHYTEEFV